MRGIAWTSAGALEGGSAAAIATGRRAAPRAKSRSIAFTLLLGAAVAGCATFGARDRVTEDEKLGWVCQSSPSADPQLWVNETLAADGTPLTRSVGWRLAAPSERSDIGGTDLFWTVPERGNWHDRLDRADFYFRYPTPRTGPVVAALRIDGETGTGVQILDAKSFRRFRKTSVLGANIDARNVPDAGNRLRAASTVEVVVSGPRGERLTLVRLPLPDWPRTDRLVGDALAAVALDATDFQHRCQRETGPEI